MPAYEARDVSDAVSLVTSCLVDVESLGDELAVVRIEVQRVPCVLAALATLAVAVLRRYSDLVEVPFEDALQQYALRATSLEEEMHPEVLRSVRDASMLMTAAADPVLLQDLTGTVSELTVPALAEITAKLLDHIQEVDFSEPSLVLTSCARDI